MQPFYFIFETIIGLASLIVLNITFFSTKIAFIDVYPHPYWLIILLVAGRYGPMEGLLSGTLTALVYSGWGIISGALQFKVFSLLNSDFTLPLAFVVLGLSVGLINKVIKKRTDGQTNKQRTPELRQKVVQAKQKPVTVNTDALSVAHLAIISMRELTLTEFCKKIPELLKTLIAVECTSIYLLRNNRLHLQYREDSSGENGAVLPDTVELDSGIMADVIRNKQAYVSAPEKNADTSEIAISAPLLNRDDQIIGILNIERLQRSTIDDNTIRTFEMLSQWIATSLGHVNRQQNEDDHIADEFTGAYSYRYFQKKLRYELARARRCHTLLTLLLVEITKFEDMSETERQNVLIVLDRIFENTLREVDIISKFDKDNIFAIILPDQNYEDTDTIIERLVKDVDSYQLRPFEHRMEFLSLKTGYAVFDPETGNYTKLLEKAETQLQASDISVVHNLFDDIEYLLKIQGKNNPEKTAVAAVTQA